MAQKSDETVIPAVQASAAPPAAPVPVTETAEFKAAVKASEDALLTKFNAMAEEWSKSMQASVATAKVEGTGVDLTSILSTLALEIGKVSDQGTDRKRVAPEELAARAAAYERMGVLLTAAQANKDPKTWPMYKLIGKVQLNDHVIEPLRRTGKNDVEQVVIYHCSQPNVAMRPVNDSAKAVYREWVRYLGGSESANSIAPQQALWLTQKGTVLANGAPATARGAGLEYTPEPIIIDGEQMPSTKLMQTTELISPTDPRATEFNVLGTIADTAKVGMVSSRVA